MAANRMQVIKRHLNPFGTGINIISASDDRVKSLTKQQIDFYDQNGYLLVKGLLKNDILEKCRAHFQAICEGREDRGQMTVMKEVALMAKGKKGEELINKIQDILHDDVFMLYTENSHLLDIVANLIGSDIMAVHSMLINKPPGTDEHPPHQDLHYFPFRPAEKIIASWTAMEKVHKDNGCLYIIPKSHKNDKLYIHDYPVDKRGVINKAYHGILNEEFTNENNRLYLNMECGDTVFFHPLLVHGSGPNITKGFRKAISCHYANSSCNYIETKNTTQHNIAREVEEMSKRRGYELDFQTLWHYRAKLVRGSRSSL